MVEAKQMHLAAKIDWATCGLSDLKDRVSIIEKRLDKLILFVGLPEAPQEEAKK